MPERRENYAQDHDLLIRVDENVKNLVLELRSLKEIDLKELKEGTKADIESLKLNKAEKTIVEDHEVRIQKVEKSLIKYVAYATVILFLFQIILAIVIKKFV